MLRCRAFPTLLLALAGPALSPQDSRPPAPIQDNSFLLEEAYNQEAGVIQHIQTFSRISRSGAWVYTFTEEWPVGGQRHQASLTVPFLRPPAPHPAGTGGPGDLLLNYRYQALGDGSAPVAFAPRVSLILPSGSVREGRGNGRPALQASLPLSVVLGDDWVTHANLGWTRTLRARDPEGREAALTAVNAGQSLVWLARPDCNLLLECAWTRGQEVAGPGQTRTVRSTFLAPGIRWAWTFASGLQVVPGLALPLGLGPSRGDNGVFLYLSFEHPLGRR